MITTKRLHELIRNGESVYVMTGMFETFLRVIPTSALRCGDQQNWIVAYRVDGSDEPRYTQMMHLYENHRQFCEQLVDSIKHDPFGMWSFYPNGRDMALHMLDTELESDCDGPPDCGFIHRFREGQQTVVTTSEPNQ